MYFQSLKSVNYGKNIIVDCAYYMTVLLFIEEKVYISWIISDWSWNDVYTFTGKQYELKYAVRLSVLICFAQKWVTINVMSSKCMLLSHM